MVLNTKSPQDLVGFLAAHRDRLHAQDPEVAGRVEEKQMRDRVIADMQHSAIGVPHMPDVTLAAVQSHFGASVSVVEIDPEQSLLEAAAWLRETGHPADVIVVPDRKRGLSEVASCEPKPIRRRGLSLLSETPEVYTMPDIQFKKDRSPNKGLRIGSYNSKSRKR